VSTSSIENLVQRFVSVWNETDEQRRRDTVSELWTLDGRHLMGAHDVRGHAALMERVAASHHRNVVEGNCYFRPATSIQFVPGMVKFRWDMVRRTTGEVVAAGVGVLVLTIDHRIACDSLFTES
jgi:hypothetical protein